MYTTIPHFTHFCQQIGVFAYADIPPKSHGSFDGVGEGDGSSRCIKLNIINTCPGSLLKMCTRNNIVSPLIVIRKNDTITGF